VRTVILTPGIKEKADLSAPFGAEGAGVFYLTNPLYQRTILNGNIRSAKLVVDDDISKSDEGFDVLTEKAERWARNWFNEAGICADLCYQGVNLGSLFVHSLTYYFVAILHALYLQETLLKKYPTSEIELYDDGGPWGNVARLLAGENNINVRIFSKPLSEKEVGAKPGAKRFFKAAFRWAGRLAAKRPAKGGVLYSCALKFAEPLLRRTKGNYYLRDEFSLRAFLLGMRCSFLHLVPESFAGSHQSPGADSFDLSGTFKKIDLFFAKSDFFNHSSHALWPVVRGRFETMIKNEFPAALRWIDCFLLILRRAEPRALVVDEDVHPFNKALVSCARDLGIKTYTMVHGVPFENIESLPLISDRVLAWGPSTKRRLAAWGVSEDKILEVGAVQYEHFDNLNRLKCREKVLKFFNISLSQKIIVYPLMSLYTNERPAPKYSRTARYLEILENTLKIAFGLVARRHDADLIIKFHPAEKNAWFVHQLADRILNEEARKRVHTVKEYNASQLLAASDLVLTTASTVYFEALLLQKSVMVFDEPDKRYCDFMSSEYLNLHDPVSSYEKMAGALEKEGTRNILERQALELNQHFHQANRRAGEATLAILENR